MCYKVYVKLIVTFILVIKMAHRLKSSNELKSARKILQKALCSKTDSSAGWLKAGWTPFPADLFALLPAKHTEVKNSSVTAAHALIYDRSELNDLLACETLSDTNKGKYKAGWRGSGAVVFDDVHNAQVAVAVCFSFSCREEVENVTIHILVSCNAVAIPDLMGNREDQTHVRNRAPLSLFGFVSPVHVEAIRVLSVQQILQCAKLERPERTGYFATHDTAPMKIMHSLLQDPSIIQSMRQQHDGLQEAKAYAPVRIKSTGTVQFPWHMTAKQVAREHIYVPNKNYVNLYLCMLIYIRLNSYLQRLL